MFPSELIKPPQVAEADPESFVRPPVGNLQERIRLQGRNQDPTARTLVLESNKLHLLNRTLCPLWHRWLRKEEQSWLCSPVGLQGRAKTEILVKQLLSSNTLQTTRKIERNYVCSRSLLFSGLVLHSEKTCTILHLLKSQHVFLLYLRISWNDDCFVSRKKDPVPQRPVLP